MSRYDAVWIDEWGLLGRVQVMTSQASGGKVGCEQGKESGSMIVHDAVTLLSLPKGLRGVLCRHVVEVGGVRSLGALARSCFDYSVDCRDVMSRHVSECESKDVMWGGLLNLRLGVRQLVDMYGRLKAGTKEPDVFNPFKEPDEDKGIKRYIRGELIKPFTGIGEMGLEERKRRCAEVLAALRDRDVVMKGTDFELPELRLLTFILSYLDKDLEQRVVVEGMLKEFKQVLLEHGNLRKELLRIGPNLFWDSESKTEWRVGQYNYTKLAERRYSFVNRELLVNILDYLEGEGGDTLFENDCLRGNLCAVLSDLRCEQRLKDRLMEYLREHVIKSEVMKEGEEKAQQVMGLCQTLSSVKGTLRQEDFDVLREYYGYSIVYVAESRFLDRLLDEIASNLVLGGVMTREVYDTMIRSWSSWKLI